MLEGRARPIRITLALMGGLAAACLFAVAASSPAEAWYCSARATTGASGWGAAPNVYTARNIALRECAVRTPRYARCYIMYCR